MAVAGVIETKAYFRKRGAETSESPQPQKRQRVVVPVLDTPDNAPLVPSPPMVADPPSENLLTSEAARTALSGPWTGPTNFHPGDNDVFEDSNDITNDRVQFDPIVQDPHADSELETSDTDFGADSGDIELSGSDTEGVPDIFETNADLNAAEHSE